MIDRKQMQRITALNLDPINRQSMDRLKAAGEQINQGTLAVGQLLQWGLDQGIQAVAVDLEALLVEVRQDPARLMRLMTENDVGDRINLTLPTDPMEAAERVWEELINSMVAQENLVLR